VRELVHHGCIFSKIEQVPSQERASKRREEVLKFSAPKYTEVITRMVANGLLIQSSVVRTKSIQ
jgi:hypothetical protein